MVVKVTALVMVELLLMVDAAVVMVMAVEVVVIVKRRNCGNGSQCNREALHSSSSVSFNPSLS